MTQHNENQGRDQFIINQPGAVSIHERECPTRSRSESLLLQAVKQEVISRLDQSLHNAVFINLGKQPQPQQVKRPWDAEIKIGTRSPEPLPAETTILEVFDRSDIAGRLLILGEPGAGKTTTMLDLAKGLCDRAEQDTTAFIPILLNLSSWKDPKQIMTAWLVEELKSKYGVRKDIGTKWLAEKQLLPLLDGLDEVKPEYLEGCVQAINRWLESEDRPPSLAVSCRREEYEKVVRRQWQAKTEEAPNETRMHLNGAILLQTLTDEQIQMYLTALKEPNLWQTMQSDEALLELIRTPLFLSIVGLSVTEHKFSFADWRSLISRESRLQYLFDVFWEAAISRVLVEPKLIAQDIQSKSYWTTKPPNAKQTRHWLVFLAQQLHWESQTEFLIEKIQFEWISDSMTLKIKLIQLPFFLFVILGCLWVAIRRNFLKDYPATSLETALLGLVLASVLLIVFFQRMYLGGEMSLTRQLNWSWEKAIRNFIESLSYGFLFGASIGLMAGSSSQLKLGGLGGIIVGFLVGCLIPKIFFSEHLEFLIHIDRILLKMAFDNIRKSLNINGNFFTIFNVIEKSVRVALLPVTWVVKHSASILFGFIFAAASFWGSTHNFSFADNLREGLINGILLGFTTGFIRICTTGWEKLKEIEPSFPNKGIKTSLRQFIVVVTTFLLVLIFLGLIISYFAQSFFLKQQLNGTYYIFSVGIGLLYGLMISWQEAPIENATIFIRHSTLRLILWLDGSIPWNYARFLNYCTERLLLQRVGGRYRFIHKSLQEHFANMRE